MKFYSTHKQTPAVSFREAVILGQSPDKGLFMPSELPVYPKGFMEAVPRLSREEIAVEVMKPYAKADLPVPVLADICAAAVDFPMPLVELKKSVYALELFHGPTMAFKDTGARFMSRCLGYFVRNMNRPVTVLVATSGDTGGAVADGFAGVDGVEVVILFPKGKVSEIQELQLTTHRRNIHSIAVHGSFDDCQRMVKEAFADPDLQKRLFLTSANSINVARWLPQQLFYFFTYRDWPERGNLPVISIPSGNFGNIAAGLWAQKSGLPIGALIAACNQNDTVPRYLQTGQFEARPTVPTISNAMDVSLPSNLARIMDIFDHDIEHVKSRLQAYSFSDQETADAMKQIQQTTGYQADPHGAVGWLALEAYRRAHLSVNGVFFETAHPVKFASLVEEITGQPVPEPGSISALRNCPVQAIDMHTDIEALKSFLLNRIA